MEDYKDIFSIGYIEGIKEVAMDEIYTDSTTRTQVLHLITKAVSDCLAGDNITVSDEIHTQIVEYIRSSFWDEEPVNYGENVQSS